MKVIYIYIYIDIYIYRYIYIFIIEYAELTGLIPLRKPFNPHKEMSLLSTIRSFLRVFCSKKKIKKQMKMDDNIENSEKLKITSKCLKTISTNSDEVDILHQNERKNVRFLRRPYFKFISRSLIEDLNTNLDRSSKTTKADSFVSRTPKIIATMKGNYSVYDWYNRHCCGWVPKFCETFIDLGLILVTIIYYIYI